MLRAQANMSDSECPLPETARKFLFHSCEIDDLVKFNWLDSHGKRKAIVSACIDAISKAEARVGRACAIAVLGLCMELSADESELNELMSAAHQVGSTSEEATRVLREVCPRGPLATLRDAIRISPACASNIAFMWSMRLKNRANETEVGVHTPLSRELLEIAADSEDARFAPFELHEELKKEQKARLKERLKEAGEDEKEKEKEKEKNRMLKLLRIGAKLGDARASLACAEDATLAPTTRFSHLLAAFRSGSKKAVTTLAAWILNGATLRKREMERFLAAITKGATSNKWAEEGEAEETVRAAKSLFAALVLAGHVPDVPKSRGKKLVRELESPCRNALFELSKVLDDGDPVERAEKDDALLGGAKKQHFRSTFECLKRGLGGRMCAEAASNVFACPGLPSEGAFFKIVWERTRRNGGKSGGGAAEVGEEERKGEGEKEDEEREKEEEGKEEREKEDEERCFAEMWEAREAVGKQDAAFASRECFRAAVRAERHGFACAEMWEVVRGGTWRCAANTLLARGWDWCDVRAALNAIAACGVAGDASARVARSVAQAEAEARGSEGTPLHGGVMSALAVHAMRNRRFAEFFELANAAMEGAPPPSEEAQAKLKFLRGWCLLRGAGAAMVDIPRGIELVKEAAQGGLCAEAAEMCARWSEGG